MLTPCALLAVNEEIQVATVAIDGIGIIGVNLWEVEGYSRECDGYSNPQFKVAT